MRSWRIILKADFLDNTMPNYTKEELQREITRALTRELYLVPQNFTLEITEN